MSSPAPKQAGPGLPGCFLDLTVAVACSSCGFSHTITALHIISPHRGMDTFNASCDPLHHSLSSLCLQTLGSIADMLYADEVTRLTTVGCRLLTAKLTTTVRHFHYRPDPWFCHTWPKALNTFPFLQTLATQHPLTRRSPPLPNALILPPSITSITFQNCLGTALIIYNLLKDAPAALPLLTTLTLDSKGDMPRLENEIFFIAHNMLARPSTRKLCMYDHYSDTRVQVCLSKLPELHFLHIPFLVSFLLPPGTPEAQPTSLETLIARTCKTAAEFFPCLPTSLTHLSLTWTMPTAVGVLQTSLLPRGLKYLSLNSIPHIASDDSCGFYSHLPPHLTMLELAHMRSELRLDQFDLLPSLVKASLRNVQVLNMFNSQMFIAWGGVLYDRPKMFSRANKLDVHGRRVSFPTLPLLVAEGTDPTLDKIRSEIESVGVLLHKMFQPNGQLVLFMPPKLCSFHVEFYSDMSLWKAAGIDDLIAVNRWPTTLTELRLCIPIPSSLSLHSLPHLTDLQFVIPRLTEQTHALLPATLRCLRISVEVVSTTHLGTLLCSLPRLLFDFSLIPALSAVPNTFWKLSPKVVAKLPRGLRNLHLLICTMDESCLPALPKRLCDLATVEGTPDWWLNRV